TLTNTGAAPPHGPDLVTDFVPAPPAGPGAKPALTPRRTMPWLHPPPGPGLGEPGTVSNRRYKIKAGYLRRSLTDPQLSAIYRNLTNSTGGSGSGMVLIGYGGQVCAGPAGAPPLAPRDVVMKAGYQTSWNPEAQQPAKLA